MIDSGRKAVGCELDVQSYSYTPNLSIPQLRGFHTQISPVTMHPPDPKPSTVACRNVTGSLVTHSNSLSLSRSSRPMYA